MLFGKSNPIKKVFGNIANTVKQTFGNWSTGQYHLPSYNYCGPGTILDNKQATNAVDNACKKHDYAYDEITKNKNNLKNQELVDKVRAADNNLINEISSLDNPGLGGHLVKNAIKAKRFLQDQGILKHNLFI